MSKSLTSLSISIICILTLLITSGCPKHPINGDLDGQWQVMEVTPEPQEVVIVERMYYCFSLHTVQLTFYGAGPWVSGNILKFDDKQLVLDFPYATSTLSKARLKQYGIYNNPFTFTI